MRRIEPDELKKILENHKHWLKEDCDGWDEMKADFSHADLSYLDLSSRDLRFADLSGADLSGADLNNCNLSHCNLTHADLRCANLTRAVLSYADLSYANLSYANLNCAEQIHVKNLFVPMTCPDYGAFIGWKKARGGLIVKLLIPEDAKRSSAIGRKCRCNKANVLEIQNEDGTKANVEEVRSAYKHDFIYRVGEMVEETNFCEDRFEECAEGIHFFVNRQEAVNYNL